MSKFLVIIYQLQKQRWRMVLSRSLVDSFEHLLCERQCARAEMKKSGKESGQGLSIQPATYTKAN